MSDRTSGGRGEVLSLVRYKVSIARLVKLTLAAIRKDKRLTSGQPLLLRFNGVGPRSRVIPRALLSLAHDTGLRRSELVAVKRGHVLYGADSDARLLQISRTKGYSEGRGHRLSVTAYRARLPLLCEVKGMIEGAVSWRFYSSRCKADWRVPRCGLAMLSGRDAYSWRTPPPPPSLLPRST